MKEPERALLHKMQGAKSQLQELIDIIALRASTVGVAEVQGVEDALRFVVDRICRHTGWPVGHVYMPAPDSEDEYVSAGIWHLEDAEALERFRTATEQTRLNGDVGLPGRILSSGRPAWVVDVWQEPGFPRAAAAKKAGLKSAVAFPIQSGERTGAVVEFFSREVMEADEQLLEAMVSIGTELGRAFQRSREISMAQQAAELYRRVVETSPDAIMVTDLNGRVLMCNQPAAIHHGAERPEAMLGLNGFDFVAPQDRERAVENARRTLETGSVRNVEYILVRRDGSRIPAELSASLIRDPEGQPRAFIAVVRNISERKQSEDALRKSEEKFRTLTEMNAAATFVFKRGRLVYANSAAGAMSGYTVEELLAIDPWKTVHPDFRERLQQAWRTTFEHPDQPPPSGFEVKIVRKAGEERWVEYSADLVEWEGGRAVLGTAYDVTERKQAEEALRDSEERYRVLYQDNPSMYFTVDATGNVLSVNQFGAEQLGYTPEELAGTPVLEVFYEEDKEEVARQLQLCIETPGKMAHWEFRKLRKDGEVIWVKEAARATLDANGELIVLIVCEDITERRRMEEELRKAREELEGKVERQMQQGRAYGLTFRELTVLHLVALGNSDREMADKLGISPLTVSKHVANILSKMSASSRSEASARAVREALLV
jgi:PAS domain S-box-containing protein